jgi:hypothetical protein
MNPNRPGTHWFLPLIRLVGWLRDLPGRVVRETLKRGDWQHGIW